MLTSSRFVTLTNRKTMAAVCSKFRAANSFIRSAPVRKTRTRYTEGNRSAHRVGLHCQPATAQNCIACPKHLNRQCRARPRPRLSHDSQAAAFIRAPRLSWALARNSAHTRGSALQQQRAIAYVNDDWPVIHIGHLEQRFVAGNSHHPLSGSKLHTLGCYRFH